MPEKETIFSSKVEYSGIFSFKEFYKFCYQWLKEETGLEVQLKAILGVYSDAQRNPLKHTISTVFIANVITGNVRENEEGEPFWQSIEDIQGCDWAFDHGKIIGHFLSWQKHQQTFWSYKEDDQGLHT